MHVFVMQRAVRVAPGFSGCALQGKSGLECDSTRCRVLDGMEHGYPLQSERRERELGGAADRPRGDATASIGGRGPVAELAMVTRRLELEQRHTAEEFSVRPRYCPRHMVVPNTAPLQPVADVRGEGIPPDDELVGSDRLDRRQVRRIPRTQDHCVPGNSRGCGQGQGHGVQYCSR